MKKKALWWILGIVLSPVLLFLILTLLLYLPPVQNWAVDKVASIASEKTGMQITVGHVNLSFPLDLGIDRFRVLHRDSLTQRLDTIAHVERLVVDVQLLPLFNNRVVIDELDIRHTSLNTNGFVEAARVKGHFDRLSLRSDGIDLDQQTVEVNGASLENARFDIAMNDSVPEDTTTSETPWKIHADELRVKNADIAFHMPGDTMSVDAHLGMLAATEAVIDLRAQAYTVKSVFLNHTALKFDQNFQPVVEGLDFNHLDLSNIHIGIEDIYYHDPVLQMNMRDFAFRDKSGMEVTELTGPVVLANGRFRLPEFRLRTPDSDIKVFLDLPLSLLDPGSKGKMYLRTQSTLSKKDIMYFLSAMPADFRHRWPNESLTIKGGASGNVNHLEFKNFEVSLPSAFTARLTGFARQFDDVNHLQADLKFDVQTRDMGFLTGMMPRDIQRDYRVPKNMSADGHVKVNGLQYFTDMNVREGRGIVKAKGTFNAAAMRYNAKLNIRNLNVHHFMPRDSIYTITADVSASGKGTDFLSHRTTMDAEARVSHLRYGSWDLDNIHLLSQVKNGRAYATVNSHNSLVNGKIGIDALLNTAKLDATFTADVHQVDLYKMNVVHNPLTVSLCGHVDISSDMNMTHYVSALVNDITIRDSSKTYRPGYLGVLLKTRMDTTVFRAQSGDFIVKLDAGENYDRLFSQFSLLGDSVLSQYERRIIDQPALKQMLPVMKLHVESKRKNPFYTLLKSQDVNYREMYFDMTSSPVTGLNGNGYLHAMDVAGVRLDTINFRISQRENKVSFGGQIRNNKRNPQFVFNALLDGVLQERGMTFGIRYFDAKDKLGARIGAKAEMVGDDLRLNLIPARPTVGYKEYNLNADNYLLFKNSGQILADVDMVADDGMGIKLYSEHSDSTALQDITLSLNKFDLKEVISVIPYAPRVTGLLNGDYHIVQGADSRISIAANMGVQDLTYEGGYLGNLNSELVYLQKGDSAHVVQAYMFKDDDEIGVLTGTYYDKDGGRLDAQMQFTETPLSLADAFAPDQLYNMTGTFNGEVKVQGPISNPIINGEVTLDSAQMVSVPYGFTLRFDSDPIVVKNSQLVFDNFGVYSINENPLNLRGSVDFSNTEHIKVNLLVRAKDYQLINARENTRSIAYGKAFVNVFASIRGELSDLIVRGRLDVLSSTDVAYILRDSPLTTDNQLDNLVRFTDFTDTTQVVVEHPGISGMRMDVTLNIAQGAHIKAWLDANHTNYIDLMGDGALRMQYDQSGDMQMTGRYSLANGEMKYSLPVVSLKTFTIQDGSYVEFTGDMMNPVLNITATERTKSTVTGSNGVSRSVEFECGVVITKTLQNMGLEFIIDAPEDMQLHGELQSMGLEERGKLAVAMLTTGVYLNNNSGTQDFSMNSALTSFLNSEISSITGNALRTLDLSFGMDNTYDATGQSHTDYSFKFAKRFLNNRLRISVGGKVSTGTVEQNRSNSFFDNVSLEYRLDQNATKYANLYFINNSYDWLDGYTQKYGGGFTWRRSFDRFVDIFRFKSPVQSYRYPAARQPNDSVRRSVPVDSLKPKAHETK